MSRPCSCCSSQRKVFFDANDAVKTPFIIGIAGSVAVGKSTTARVLKELLQRWPSSPKVDLVTTDGFLWPNEVLRRQNLMDRKGFPESYDVGAILRFLSASSRASASVQAPLYSHLTYDVLPGRFVTIDRPDILIFEGINVLQTRELPRDGAAVPFVSDFFDFSIYIDAPEEARPPTGTWSASCGCARPPSATPNPSSTAIRSFPATPRSPSPRACGPTST